MERKVAQQMHIATSTHFKNLSIIGPLCQEDALAIASAGCAHMCLPPMHDPDGGASGVELTTFFLHVSKFLFFNSTECR